MSSQTNLNEELSLLLENYKKKVRNKTIDEFSEKIRLEYENKVSIPKQEKELMEDVLCSVIKQMKEDVEIENQ